VSQQAKLDAFKSDFEAGKPPYVVPRSAIETMHRAAADLLASDAAARVKKLGDDAPEFALSNSDGDIVRSTELLKNGPLIVSLHRGAWCPYYDVELRAIEVAKPEFDKYGASLVAISPQTPPNSRKSARRNKLTFPILSDTKSDLAAAFGLCVRLPDYLIELAELIEICKWLRNDVPSFNGDLNWTLLVPARYVIGPDGTILYADANPDHRRRLEPHDLIPALEQAAVVST
jgi:peroxiredoxin